MVKTDQWLVNSRMAEEVLRGLGQSPKTLPSKYFYDERGSELFEEICRLEEYYLTSAEMEILEQNIGEISEMIGPNSIVIEFGSGNSLKTRLLLKGLTHVLGYIPVDISREFLFEEASRLQKEFPQIDVHPVAADYSEPFEMNLNGEASKRVIFFPGSTIGNFTPGQARVFLSGSADLLGENGGLLIGVDLKKDPKILNRAYNDSKGVTAEFNKNLLWRLNRELDANFDPDQFEHHAFYNSEEGRIEMHLVSVKDQRVVVADRSIEFQKGETIHTENSYKYTRWEFEDLISDTFEPVKVWTDSKRLFCLHYFQKR